MKTDKLWLVLALCIMSIMFLANRPFVENQKAVALLPIPISTSVNQAVVANTKHTVIIKGMTFDPASLHVSKGDVVRWINKDIVPHNVTDFPEAKWTSGTLALDSFWEKHIDETFDYNCSIHPTMKGKIIVDLPKEKE